MTNIEERYPFGLLFGFKDIYAENNSKRCDALRLINVDNIAPKFVIITAKEIRFFFYFNNQLFQRICSLAGRKLC
jgi:hypothetical protein